MPSARALALIGMPAGHGTSTSTSMPVRGFEALCPSIQRGLVAGIGVPFAGSCLVDAKRSCEPDPQALVARFACAHARLQVATAAAWRPCLSCWRSS